MKPQPKPVFLERMQKLLGKDFEKYMKILKKEPVKSIRCNKLKISPAELKKKLQQKGWKIKQPFKKYPEVMIVEGKITSENNNSKKNNVNTENRMDVSINNPGGGGWGSGGKILVPLEPGELGRTLEHLLGYYYIQELASMLPVIVLKPKPNQMILDLCAAPGSKTTQIAAEMRNTGTIIANDISLGRIKILASNLERCGVVNTIITRKEGFSLCKRLKNANLKEVGGQGQSLKKIGQNINLVPSRFDKILVDAPCSGEGTIRSSPKTLLMWNIKSIKSLSKIQKSLLSAAIEILKPGGEIVYSTCTHAPEENEEVIDFILKKFRGNIKIEDIKLPIKCRMGITSWNNIKYGKNVAKSCRIYPHDADTEGFFITKFRRVK